MAFCSGEKGFIKDVFGDKIHLLTKEDAEQLLNKESKSLKEKW